MKEGKVLSGKFGVKREKLSILGLKKMRRSYFASGDLTSPRGKAAASRGKGGGSYSSCRLSFGHLRKEASETG